MGSIPFQRQQSMLPTPCTMASCASTRKAQLSIVLEPISELQGNLKGTCWDRRGNTTEFKILTMLATHRKETDK